MDCLPLDQVSIFAYWVQGGDLVTIFFIKFLTSGHCCVLGMRS